MDRQPGVESNQATSLSAGHLNEIGIVYLLMTEGLPVDRGLARVRRRPETMLLVRKQFAQKRGRLFRRHGCGRVGWIRRKPDEPQLSHRAACPAMPGLEPKPAVHCGVMLVVRPGEREEDICIEESRFHVASSARSFRARLLGMTGASAPTWKTGRPLRREVAALTRKPRRASCDKTFPNFFPEEAAKVCAASKTSSSKDTVVRIMIR